MNAERRKWSDERTCRYRHRPPWLPLALLSSIMHSSSVSFAARTEQEILRGISQGVESGVDAGKVLAVVFACAAVVILLMLLSYRSKRTVSPRPLNHHGRLIREVSRSIGLSSAELKQLRSQAEQRGLSNPLLLLLCPSLMEGNEKRGDVNT